MTITNSHTPETINIPVTKVWEDNDDQDQLRPENITVTLYANGQATDKTITLNNKNDWKDTFTNLDKYANGKEIEYTVKEEKVSNYVTTITGDSSEGFTITNTRIKYSKESDPESGTTVTNGDEITYIIHLDNTAGSVAMKVKVKDTIPAGTTFVEGSITIGGEVQGNLKAQDLEDGIEVNLEAGESKDVTFTVRVNDLENGESIRNYATINQNPDAQEEIWEKTNTTENTYIEAIIESQKEMETANNLNYAVQGEKITYTIRIENSGDLDANVVIKDSIPEGTTLVDGSIKVNGESSYTINGEEIDLKEKTAEDLVNGITVNVGANSQTTVSFEVIVNENAEGEIVNIALVDGEQTNEVTIPVLVAEKVSTVIRHDEESTLEETEVTAYDQIRYTIKVTNTGTTEITDVEVKDNVPEGTTLVNIENDGIQAGDEITWKIDSIQSGETVEVSFIVKVKYSAEEFTITNVATVDDKLTNETENLYNVPEPEIDDNIYKEGTNKITQETQEVEYTITYTVDLRKYVGDATITIVDTLPYKIDEDKSDLGDGSYDGEYTITWTIELEDINTYEEENETYIYTITKQITVVFSDLDVTDKTFINKVVGKIDLEEIGKVEETEPAETETETEFTVDVTVNKVWDHTNNIYTIPTSIELQVKNEEDVIDSYVVTEDDNWSHTFTGLDKYDEDGNEIIYTVDEEEVTTGDLDYYKSSIEGTTITNVYNGPIISQEKSFTTENNLGYVVEGEKITYTITIINDGGVAKDVELKDSIPEGTTLVDGSIKVNGESSYTINGEEINLKEKTAEDLANGIIVNVEANSQTTVSFEVIVNENAEGEIVNTALVDGEQTNEVTIPVLVAEKVSTVIRHDEESTLEETEVTAYDQIRYTIKVTNTGTTEITDVEVKDNVPEGTTLVNIENDGIQAGDEITWKIDSIQSGETIEVSFTVRVEYSAKYFTITNVATVDDKPTNETENPYDVPETEIDDNISKEGTESITQKDEEVTYEITYTVDLKKYVGDATVTIVDILPYKIDEDKSNLDGGSYDGEYTITWTIELEDINTYEEENETYTYTVTKEITVVFSDLDPTQRNMTNNVNGAIYLYETETTNTVEDTCDTAIKIIGKLIVKYIDVDTNEEILYVDEETGEYKTYGEESESYVGDLYSTESKDIPYYRLVEELIPANKDGEYAEEDTYVIYYYEKLPFNMSVDKSIEKIVIDGEEQNISDNKLSRIEVSRKSVDSTQVEITYNIVVSNTGEIEGTAIVEETIPEYLEVKSNGTSSEWQETEDGNLIAEVELGVGETKELKVVVSWKNGNSNFGTQNNTVTITDTSNPANFEETTLEDNTSEAEIIIGIGTGIKENIEVYIACLTMILVAFAIFLYVKKRKIQK